jgi:uncharacterized integral membrane protein
MDNIENEKETFNNDENKLETGEIIGIVAGCIVILILVLFVLNRNSSDKWWFFKLKWTLIIFILLIIIILGVLLKFLSELNDGLISSICILSVSILACIQYIFFFKSNKNFDRDGKNGFLILLGFIIFGSGLATLIHSLSQ